MKTKYFSRLLTCITNSKSISALFRLSVDGYLYNSGWFESVKQTKPVDVNGHPIPWLTYPAVDFLSERLKPEMSVFEYGSGNSTYFLANRVASVASVEYDKSWYDKVKENLPKNVNLIFENRVESGEYVETIFLEEKKYDLILIDGRERVNCSKMSINALSSIGVIILDNSDRDRYLPTFEYLTSCGFKFLNFWGIVPGYIDKSCTTIFYRTKNCFNL